MRGIYCYIVLYQQPRIFCYIVILLGDNILWGIKRSTTVPLFSSTSFCIHTKRIHTVFALNGKETSSRFNLTYRYIDDVLSINNPEFENYLGQMYPAELEIKDTTKSITSPSYLDWERCSTSHFHSRQTRCFQFQHHKLSVPE